MEQATHDASLQVQPLPPPERIRKGVVVAAEPVIVGNAAAYLCFSQVGLVNIETSLKNPKDRTIPPRAKQEPFSGVEYHFSSPDQPPQVITVGSPKREDGVRDFMPSKTTKVVAGADDVICDYDMIAATSSGDVIVPAYFLLKTLGIRAYLNTSVSTGDVSSQHHVLMILPTTEGTNVVLHLPPEVGNTQNALAAYIKSVLTGSAGIVKGKPAEEAKSARVTQTGGLIDMDTNRNGTVGLLEAAKEKYPAVRNNHTGLALGVLRAFVGGAKRFNGNLANDPALRTEGLEIDSDIIERERLRNFILEADLPTLLDVCDLFADTLAANPLTQRHLAAISESSGDFQPVSGDAILPPYLREVVGAVVLANLGGKVIKADDELIGQRMRLDSILRETQEIREQTTQAKKKLEERVTAHHDAKRILEQEKSMQLREIEAIAERNRAEFAQRRADFAREVDLETQLLREEKTRLAHKQRSELDKHEENLRQTLITIHSAHADFERQIAKGRAESGRRAETLGVLRQELARLDEQLADIKKRLADKRSQVETLEPQPKIKFKPITVNPSQGLIPRRLRRYAFIIDA